MNDSIEARPSAERSTNGQKAVTEGVFQWQYDIAQARKREGDIDLVPFEEQVA